MSANILNAYQKVTLNLSITAGNFSFGMLALLALTFDGLAVISVKLTDDTTSGGFREELFGLFQGR